MPDFDCFGLGEACLNRRFLWVLVFVTRSRVLENGGILLRANTRRPKMEACAI
jgi:hypothetical protein